MEPCADSERKKLPPRINVPSPTTPRVASAGRHPISTAISPYARQQQLHGESSKRASLSAVLRERTAASRRQRVVEDEDIIDEPLDNDEEIVIIKRRKRREEKAMSVDLPADEEVETPKKGRSRKVKEPAEVTNGDRVTRMRTRKMATTTDARKQEDREDEEPEPPPKRTRPQLAAPEKASKLDLTPVPFPTKSPKAKAAPLQASTVVREPAPSTRGTSMRPGRTHSSRQHAAAARPTFSARIDEEDELPPIDNEELNKIKLPEFSIPTGFKFAATSVESTAVVAPAVEAASTPAETPSLLSRLGPEAVPSTSATPKVSAPVFSTAAPTLSFTAPSATPFSFAPKPSTSVASSTVEVSTTPVDVAEKPAANQFALPGPPSASTFFQPKALPPPTPGTEEGRTSAEETAPATTVTASEAVATTTSVAPPAPTTSAGFSFLKVSRLCPSYESAPPTDNAIQPSESKAPTIVESKAEAPKPLFSFAKVRSCRSEHIIFACANYELAACDCRKIRRRTKADGCTPFQSFQADHAEPSGAGVYQG
jgi:hypothetical protein